MMILSLVIDLLYVSVFRVCWWQRKKICNAICHGETKKVKLMYRRRQESILVRCALESNDWMVIGFSRKKSKPMFVCMNLIWAQSPSKKSWFFFFFYSPKINMQNRSWWWYSCDGELHRHTIELYCNFNPKSRPAPSIVIDKPRPPSVLDGEWDERESSQIIQ